MLSSGVKEYSEQFGDRDLDTPTMLLGGNTWFYLAYLINLSG